MLNRLTRAVLWVALLLSASIVQAETRTLPQRAELKAEKFSDAADVAVLDAKTRVTIVKCEGSWLRVNVGKQQGWLREEAFAVRPAKAGLLALESGRSGRSELVATTGIRGISRPPSAQIHALIMTIGAYDKPHQLEGVSKDADSAREIALRMGVPEANLRILRDRELTVAGMQQAFDALEARVLDNDQIFIYFSGHGGRQTLRDANGDRRCAESLTTIDGFGLFDAELSTRLQRLSARTQKIVMFIDACHSGGATTRSVGAKSAFKPKHWNGKGFEVDKCSTPVNVLTRSIDLAGKSAGSGGNNFAYIAAARDDEVAFDQAQRGGVATQAWLACMVNGVKDTDGSGGISVEEIRQCAQERIDQQLRNAEGVKPHHVTVTGNANLVLSFAQKSNEPEKPSPVATPVQTAPTAPPPEPAKPSPPPAASDKPSPLAALNDIHNNRDDRRLVTFRVDSSSLRIGKDALDFFVTSREAGYLYLLMVGSDGATFDLLFPNQIDRNNLIQAGETLHLPRSSWKLTAQGPAGKNTLLAIVTDAPRDFSKAGLKPAGPFSVVGAVAAKDIQLVTVNSAQAETNECQEAQQTRNLVVQKNCSSAYGAALLVIEEVAP
jgi:hypothetical protein